MLCKLNNVQTCVCEGKCPFQGLGEAYNRLYAGVATTIKHQCKGNWAHCACYCQMQPSLAKFYPNVQAKGGETDD